MEIPGIKARIDQIFKELEKLTGANPPCPLCANRDWMRTGLGRVVELRIVAEEDPLADPLFTTALGLTCTRCGFIRLHEVDPASWGMPGLGGH